MPRSTPSNFSILETLDEIDRQNLRYEYDAVDVIRPGPVRVCLVTLGSWKLKRDCFVFHREFAKALKIQDEQI